MKLSQTFSARLALAIKHDPRPIKTIAGVAGYSPNHISAVQNGRRTNPTLQFIETMAATLNRDPAWLLGIGDVA